MGDRRADNALRDIDALFRLGVLGGMSDGQLLDRFVAQAGPESERAFEAIVQRHGPMVLGVCRRALGDEHAAEDAFQATFMVLALKARAIRKRESLGPWLHGVAVRIARRARASRQRNQAEPIPPEGPAGPEGVEALSIDLRGVLDEELGRLPDKYRIPVVLCYLEGQSQEHAARTLGWTKGTVSGRLARAKDILRHRLSRRGLAPSVGAIAAAFAPDTASASVPASLVAPAVRAAAAAVLGGTETGAITGQAVILARQAMKVMLIGRFARTAAQVLFLSLGAAALATPLTRPGELARLRNWAGRPAVAPAPAADLSRPDLVARQLDRSGDPLPSGALVRLGTTRRRHSTGLAGLDFTRDGAAVVTAQDNGLVHFWDAVSGREIRTIDMLESARVQDKLLRDFALSPDGSLMAAAGFAFDPELRRIIHRVSIRGVKRGQLQREFEVPAVDLFSVAFSPDGATLATGGFAGEVGLWDVASGDRLATLKLGNAPVRSIAFAPDGRVLAVNEERKGTRLWDLAASRETVLSSAGCGPTAPVFSPDSRLLAINLLDGEAELWDRASGQKHLAVQGQAVVFAPDSRSLAMMGTDGGTFAVIDVETGSERWHTRLGWGAGNKFAYSADGKTIVTAQGGVLRFFDAATGRERLGDPEAHESGVSFVRYVKDGHTLQSAGDDGTIRLWDVASGRQTQVLREAGPVHGVAISPDGTTLATAVQTPVEGVSLWDLATGGKRPDWPEHGAIIGAEALAFSPDGGSLLVFDRDQVLRSFEIATGRDRDIEQPLFSRGDDGGLGSSITRAAFSMGNQFIAASTDRTASVADLSTGAERLSTPGVAMSFTPDGRCLAVAVPAKPEVDRLADGSFRTFAPIVEGIDVVGLTSLTRKRVATWGDSVTAVAFSADGKVMAVAGGWANPMIRLYNTDDGREFGQYRCPARITRGGALAFSPDGRSLAAGLDDTTVLIWAVTDVLREVR
jgi:RNA polymerase sigma factor (sigma-70 family)